LKQTEKDAIIADRLAKLRTTSGVLFNISVPVNVTVVQIKTYLNNWVNTNVAKLPKFVGNVNTWKQHQIDEAEAAGNTVEAWLIQAVKIYRNLGKVI